MRDQRRAGASTLAKITPLLDDLRHIDTLEERRPGVFCAAGREILHFHELPDAIVADVLLQSGTVRLPASSRSEQLDVLERVWRVVENLERSRDRTKRRRRRPDAPR